MCGLQMMRLRQQYRGILIARATQRLNPQVRPQSHHVLIEHGLIYILCLSAWSLSCFFDFTLIFTSLLSVLASNCADAGKQLSSEHETSQEVASPFASFCGEKNVGGRGSPTSSGADQRSPLARYLNFFCVATITPPKQGGVVKCFYSLCLLKKSSCSSK